MSKEYENKRKSKKGVQSSQNPAESKRMVLMRLSGSTLQDIANEFGKNPSSVMRRINVWKSDNKIEYNKLVEKQNETFINGEKSEKQLLRRHIAGKTLFLINERLDQLTEQVLEGKAIDRQEYEWLFRIKKLDQDTDAKLVELNTSRKIEVDTNYPDLGKILAINEFKNNK